VPRENALQKSRRLLASGAVSIVRHDPNGTLALVKGDSAGIHVVFYDSAWHCDCDARGLCSHGLAVAAVCPPPGPWLADAGLMATVGGRTQPRGESA
jgi:hypothetical protein